MVSGHQKRALCRVAIEVASEWYRSDFNGDLDSNPSQPETALIADMPRQCSRL